MPSKKSSKHHIHHHHHQPQPEEQHNRSSKRRKTSHPSHHHHHHQQQPYSADSLIYQVPTTATSHSNNNRSSKSKSKSKIHNNNNKMMGSLNPHMRTSIRPSYITTATATATATPPSMTERTNPLLLLLDLNGTLLFRPNRASSSSHASAHPIHRPYLRSFLLYALGIPSTPEEALARRSAIDRSILNHITDWTPTNKKGRIRQQQQTAQALHQINSIHAAFNNIHLGSHPLPHIDTDDSETTTADPADPNQDDADLSSTETMTQEELDLFGPWQPLPSSPKESNNNNDAPRLNLVVWSSAKPENVHRMVRSILLPTWEEATEAYKHSHRASDAQHKLKFLTHVGLPPASHASVALLARLQTIWARDTLVPINSHWYDSKVQCVKDMEIVWFALNRDGPKAQPRDVNTPWDRGQFTNRLSARDRADQDQYRPDAEGADWVPASASGAEMGAKVEKASAGGAVDRSDKPLIGSTPGSGSAAAEAAYLAATTPSSSSSSSSPEGGPTAWSARNTLLLDDSPLKAALQPYNHLCVPEFDNEGARRARAMRERLVGVLLPELAAARRPPRQEREEKEEEEKETPGKEQGGGGDGEELSLWNQDVRLLPPTTDGQQRPNSPPKNNTANNDESAAIDDVLLQLIGVLEEARKQQNVAAWIYAGGLGGFGRSSVVAPVSASRRPQSSASAKSWRSGQGASAGGSGGTRAASDNKSPEHVVKRLPVPDEPSAEAWAQRGREVLRRHGIPLFF
ncbi:hypothetical protein V8E36_005319 [Tilletia maclaganii]